MESDVSAASMEVCYPLRIYTSCSPFFLSFFFPCQGSSTPRAYNVVVFGETGVGKSSLINLITRSYLAKTSPDVNACTKRSEQYEVTIGGREFRIWDTVGLGAGSSGPLNAALAQQKLKRFLKRFVKNGNLDLLVYCVRGGRATHAHVRHYKTFYFSVCKAAIPVVIVVTCLENISGEMDSWWSKNAEKFRRYGMVFDGHACVTTLPEDSSDSVTLKSRRASSRQAVHDLLFRNCVVRHSRQNIFDPVSRPNTVNLPGQTGSIWRNPATTLLAIFSRRAG